MMLYGLLALSATAAALSRAAPRMGGHAVIVQNKGGGHGEIGFHLAAALRAKDVGVTILQDAAAKKTKLPYSKCVPARPAAQERASLGTTTSTTSTSSGAPT